MDRKFLLVFGEGGHAAQMHRLLALLNESPSCIIALVDKAGISENISHTEYVLASVRDKYRNSLSRYIYVTLSSVFLAARIILREKPNIMISTGPGICIIPAIVMRLLGRKVIYIETWSRFFSRSLTGLFMYRIATTFYYQNAELAKFYPDGEFSGRL